MGLFQDFHQLQLFGFIMGLSMVFSIPLVPFEASFDTFWTRLVSKRIYYKVNHTENLLDKRLRDLNKTNYPNFDDTDIIEFEKSSSTKNPLNDSCSKNNT